MTKSRIEEYNDGQISLNEALTLILLHSCSRKSIDALLARLHSASKASYIPIRQLTTDVIVEFILSLPPIVASTRLNNVSTLLVALAKSGFLDISLFHQVFLETVLKLPAERIAEFLYLISRIDATCDLFSVMHFTRLLLLSCDDDSILQNTFRHLFRLDPTEVKQHYHGYVNSIIWLGSERNDSTISRPSAAFFESMFRDIRRNIATLETVEDCEAYESFIHWIKFQLECSSDCSWYKHIFREELLKIFSHVKLSKDEQNICCLFDAFTNIAPPDSPYPDLSKTERLLQLLISISSTTSDGDKESLDLIGSLIFQSIWSCKNKQDLSFLFVTIRCYVKYSLTSNRRVKVIDITRRILNTNLTAFIQNACEYGMILCIIIARVIGLEIPDIKSLRNSSVDGKEHKFQLKTGWYEAWMKDIFCHDKLGLIHSSKPNAQALIGAMIKMIEFEDTTYIRLHLNKVLVVGFPWIDLRQQYGVWARHKLEQAGVKHGDISEEEMLGYQRDIFDALQHFASKKKLSQTMIAHSSLRAARFRKYIVPMLISYEDPSDSNEIYATTVLEDFMKMLRDMNKISDDLWDEWGLKSEERLLKIKRKQLTSEQKLSLQSPIDVDSPPLDASPAEAYKVLSNALGEFISNQRIDSAKMSELLPLLSASIAAVAEIINLPPSVTYIYDDEKMSLTYQPPTYPMYTVSAVDSIISSIHHVLHNQSTFPFDTTDFLSTLTTAISNSPVILQCLFDRFFELLYMNSNSEESAFPSIRLYVTIGFVLGLILKNESHAPYVPVVFQSSTSSVIKYEKFGLALLYPCLNWPIETLQAYRPKSTWVVGFMCVMTSLLSHQYSERPMASLFDENFEHRLHYVSLYIHTKSAGESVRCAINSFDKALEIAIDLNLIKSLENVDLTQAWLRWGDFGEKEILRHIAKSTSKIRTLREALGYSLESAVYLFKQSPVVSKEGIPARFRLVADAIIANSAEEDRALLYPTWIWDVMEGSAEAKVEDLLEFIAALEPEYLLVGGCQHRMPMEDFLGRCRTVSSRFISNKDNFLTVVNIIMRCLIWDWKHSESGEAYFKNCLLSLPALSPFVIREWNRLCGPNSGEILDWLTTAFRKINDEACVLGYEFIAEAFVMEHSIFKINYENTIIPSLEELVSHCSILKSKMPDFIDASYQISMKMYLKLVEPYLREVDPFVAILSSNNSLIHSTRQTLLTIISHHPELSIRLSDKSFLRVPLISILHPYENVMTSRQQTLAVWTIISQMNPTTLTKVFQKNGQLSWEIITTMAVIVFGKGDEVVVGTSSPRDEHPMSLTTREQILDVLMICDSIGEELEMDDSTIVAYKKFKLFFRHQLEEGDFLG